MTTTVYEVLEELRGQATSEADKGSKLERLMEQFLRTDPMYADQFSDVYLWNDWPGREGKHDTGIDLVAVDRTTGTNVAIQCKFYAPGSTIGKQDIDSFLSASGKEGFGERIIVSTTDKWNGHAEDAIQGQQIPVRRIGMADLEASPIDWDEFDWSAPQHLPGSDKKKLRPHQVEAVTAVVDGLATKDRGKLIMACGTGKTFTYEPFPGLILTDTFQSWENDDRLDTTVFVQNNARLEELKKLNIQVIVGNPPYSSGQDSANDNNANEKYPDLDAAIRDTYATRSTATLKNSLYDSYIRAIKWATLRIKDRGVIAYVTNGGFLDSNTADGMRKTLTDEFSDIYIYNLRGNARTAGEQRKKEGGGVFLVGSRATVAITLLVRDPAHAGPAEIHYTDIGDYLTRDQKLATVAGTGCIAGLPSATITPNDHGDWLNQRRDDFHAFLPVGDKEGPSIFTVYSGGLKTNRDPWVYGSGRLDVLQNAKRMVETFNREQAALASDRAHKLDRDPKSISWDVNTEKWVRTGRNMVIDSSAVRTAQYRPFNTQHVYFSRDWNPRQGNLPMVFPTSTLPNFGFYVLNPGADKPFSVLMLDRMPDLAFYGSNAGQHLTRWRYEKVDADDGRLALGNSAVNTPIDGYRRIDNITDEALGKR